MTLCEYEVRALRHIMAPDLEPMTPGGALNQSLEALRGSGYLDADGITLKGLSAVMDSRDPEGAAARDFALLYGDGRPSPRGLLSTQTCQVNRPDDWRPDSRQVRRARDRQARKTGRVIL